MTGKKKKDKTIYMVWVEYDLCFNVVNVRGVNEKLVAVVEKQMHICERLCLKTKHKFYRCCGKNSPALRERPFQKEGQTLESLAVEIIF